MRRKHLLHALIVAHACALAGCGDDQAADAPCIDPSAYPAAPEGASSRVYVSAACPAAGADGSSAHPFPTIAEALPRAAPGAAVLIAPGTYAEVLEISQEVALVGSSDPSSPEAAAVVIEGKGEDVISVTGDKEVTLRGLHVVKAGGLGVRVEGAPVTVEGCAIDDVSATDEAEDLSNKVSGIAALDDASIIIQNSAVTGAAGIGVYVGSARAIIIQNTIRGSRGAGIRVDTSMDQARIEGNTIEDSTQTGIGIYSSRAIIIQNVIKGTGRTLVKVDPDSPPSYETGYGVTVASATVDEVAQGPSDVELSGNEIIQNAGVGVLCAAGARGIIIQNNTIDENGDTKGFGAGVWLQEGAGGAAENIIEGNTLSENRFIGVGMVGETHGIIIQKNMVRGTRAGLVFMGADSYDMGDGIGIFSGASAQLLGNMIEENDRGGLILDKANSATTAVTGNTFRGNRAYGIILQDQMDVPATDVNLYEGNTLGTVGSVAAGTFAVKTDALITH